MVVRVRDTSRKRQQRKPSGFETLEQRRLLATDLLITELMYHPASGQPNDEWIELFNRSDQAVSLDGLKIVDGVQFEFPSVTVDAKDYLVVAADVDAFLKNYPDASPAVGGWEGIGSGSVRGRAPDRGHGSLGQ